MWQLSQSEFDTGQVVAAAKGEEFFLLLFVGVLAEDLANDIFGVWQIVHLESLAASCRGRSM